MNLIHWADQHLDYRCSFMPTMLNINGETETATIRLKSRQLCQGSRMVTIVRESGEVIEVYLDDLEPMTESLYYFDTPDGVSGSLLIPFPQETDDGC
ncbi:hypothetical protein [Xanthomonas phage X1]|nr:hypothetical protein [Xanthomonas phage X1]